MTYNPHGPLSLTGAKSSGLAEVPDLPDSARQDPLLLRTKGRTIGRDGCSVPLPWISDASNFGFTPPSGQAAHLPQPAWMANFAVDLQSDKPGSTLHMYREALKLRRELQTKEDLEWVQQGEDVEKEVLHFKREGGWEVIMNFEGEGVRLPKGVQVLLCSGEELKAGEEVPKNTTVWFRRSD